MIDNFNFDHNKNKLSAEPNNILLSESDAYRRMGILAGEPKEEVDVKKAIEEQNKTFNKSK